MDFLGIADSMSPWTPSLYLFTNRFLASETPAYSIPTNYNLREDRYLLSQRNSNEPQLGRSFIKTHSRVMVLGTPGSGKTTFLKHLAVACANQELLVDYIPIFIELRSISLSEFSLSDSTKFNLIGIIHQQFIDLMNVEKVKQILKDYKWLFLIDGIDEVAKQYQKPLQDCIRDFARQYSQSHLILTCRTQTSEYTIPGFDYVEIAEFDQPKIEKFAENWFAVFLGEEGEKLTQDFFRALRLPDHKATYELAKTPILLSLICWVFTCDQELPIKRSDLYHKGINLLLKEWDRKRGVKRQSTLNIDDIQNLLGHLAIQKFQQVDNFMLFTWDELRKYFIDLLKIDIEDSKAIPEEIEAYSGLLIERAHEVYSFSHLTFHEYFTAYEITKTENLKSLEMLANHIAEPRWREVILLTAEMLPSADSLLKLIKQKIDGLLSKDDSLQKFLRWVGDKSKLAKAPYGKAEIRFFYFDLILNLSTNYDDHDDIFKIDHFRIRNALYAPDLSFDQDLCTLYAFASNGLSAFFGFCAGTIYRDFMRILNQVGDNYPELKLELESLHTQLANPAYEWELQKQWWQENWQTWFGQLRSVMIKHRNIGHNWQFSSAQTKLLHRYYEASLLLVECLEKSCSSVREEIEETLCLPIASHSPSNQKAEAQTD
jgi:predicted NACHT family NTPase